MPYDPVLGIDLGASYTKISLRSQRVQPNAQVVYADWVMQVPSLVIQVGRDWFFGDDAMNLNPDPNWNVYSNWKEILYLKRPASGYGQASIVACKFFEWLLDLLKKHGVHPDAQRVRVCVPALTGVEHYASTVAQSMQMAGWPTRIQSDYASEPRANIVGIMSGGRNCLLRTNSLGYGPMFPAGGFYRHEFDRYFRKQRDPILKICILDVGSFTTDLACVRLDLSDVDSDGIVTASQESWLHGIINELDLAVLSPLCANQRVDLNRILFTEREQIKEKLYGLQQHALTTGQILGSPGDHQVINRGLDGFSANLWIKIESEVATFKPEFCCLTGGGCQIAGIQTRLTKYFDGAGCRVISVPTADQRYNPHQTERIATALGASSVIFDDPAAVPRAYAPPIGSLTSEDVECRCRGANKECCFCSGRGFYRTA